MPVRVPFSKSTVFEICRQKMCRFRVKGRPICHIFHRFQNVPASCEHSLRVNSDELFNGLPAKLVDKWSAWGVKDAYINISLY